MRFPSSPIAFAFCIGLQAVLALPTADGERGRGRENGIGRGNGLGNANRNNENAQLAQLLRGTGLRGVDINQLNVLLQNMQAMGITLGCEDLVGGGAGGNGTEAGAGAGGEEAGGEEGGEEGEGSKWNMNMVPASRWFLIIYR